MLEITTGFMKLFEGLSKAYGIYRIPLATDPGSKVKGEAASIKGAVTTELWEKHLSGEQGLGIIPINDESNVRFAALDIDEYPLNLLALARDIDEYDLPLVVTRTKSGGAHLYLFLSEWTSAVEVYTKLKEIAAFLGRGSAEIYPKQTKILAARGDVGQWINMPYFHAYKTNRYAVDKTGRPLSPEEFVALAEQKMTSLAGLRAIQLEIPEELPGGPPCLQHILLSGFPEGTRNNGLFNLGVYAQRSSPDNWTTLVDELNGKYMQPPLPATEVLAVIRSLRKKEYFYTCNTSPLAQHCNKAKCRKCKFGIGDGDLGMPVMNSLTKVLTVPPTWFVDIEGGGRIILETDDLQSPLRFQLRCMEQISIMPMLPKRDTWQGIIARLLENLHVIEVPKDSTPPEILVQHLREFLTCRVQANKIEEIVLGKPFKSNSHYVFRFRDFLKYLERMKFYEYKMGKIGLMLQERTGATTKFLNLAGAGVNVLLVPTKQFEEQTTGFETPAMEGSSEY